MKKSILSLMLLALLLLLAACVQQVPETTVALLPERLDIQMAGSMVVTLEYGQTYKDPGAEGLYYARGVVQTAQPVKVQVDNTVDFDKVGSYTITYTAVHENMQTRMTRVVRIVDTKAPVITLESNPDIYTEPGQEYQEEGFSASDNYDGDLTARVEKRIENDTVIYTVSDSSGNQTQVTRPIVYDDRTAPVLMLAGEKNMSMVAGTRFQEPGYTALDNCQGDMTAQVEVSGLNPYIAGTYTVTYCVTDAYGNTAQDTRTVTVTPVGQPARVVPEGKVIYLTFDDGPSPHTKRLLQILKKYDVKATFFVVAGGYQSPYMDALKMIVDDGHSIGIHSTTHNYELTYASEDVFYADLYKMQDIIYQYTGVRTTLLRFPGGSSNTVSYPICPGIMTKLVQGVQDQGFQYFDWNVSSGDGNYVWDSEKVYDAVTSGVANTKRTYSIVLQHDSKGYSVDTVERIILWGLENGYTFLPLTPDSPTYHHTVLN